MIESDMANLLHELKRITRIKPQIAMINFGIEGFTRIIVNRHFLIRVIRAQNSCHYFLNSYTA
jgi:hypothetical protein